MWASYWRGFGLGFLFRAPTEFLAPTSGASHTSIDGFERLSNFWLRGQSLGQNFALLFFVSPSNDDDDDDADVVRDAQSFDPTRRNDDTVTKKWKNEPGFFLGNISNELWTAIVKWVVQFSCWRKKQKLRIWRNRRKSKTQLFLTLWRP